MSELIRNCLQTSPLENGNKRFKLMKKTCVPHRMGTRLLKGIYTPTLELGLGPKGHPSFVEGGGPSSYLVLHTRARTAALNRAEFGAGCIYISVSFLF